jgi:hypothetical protein
MTHNDTHYSNLWAQARDEARMFPRLTVSAAHPRAAGRARLSLSGIGVSVGPRGLHAGGTAEGNDTSARVCLARV